MLETWRRAAATSRSDPPLLAAALLWEAWEINPPLERQIWLGNLLVPALLRERRKTRAHLLCLNSALRHVRSRSGLPALVDFVMARPIASAGMVRPSSASAR
jgi:hypothetical protein